MSEEQQAAAKQTIIDALSLGRATCPTLQSAIVVLNYQLEKAFHQDVILWGDPDADTKQLPLHQLLPLTTTLANTLQTVAGMVGAEVVKLDSTVADLVKKLREIAQLKEQRTQNEEGKETAGATAAGSIRDGDSAASATETGASSV